MEVKESWGVLVGAELAMACGGVGLGHSFFPRGFSSYGVSSSCTQVLYHFSICHGSTSAGRRFHEKEEDMSGKARKFWGCQKAR
jgi:hypothetical protein